ncbi:MAG: hypothetical protein QOD76_1172, partial [Solirubrobacteraceae bacterium]|nr:hypothetical protein [Solirubrobacteraceae bacterium]
KLSGVNVWRYVVLGDYTTAYPFQDHSDFRIRQATCNLLFDAGITPDTPESDLTVGPLPNPPPEPQPEPQPQPQPQPEPQPQPKIAPRVNVKSRIVSVARDGKLFVKVSAPSDQKSLGATLALTTASRVKETTRGKASFRALGARGFSLKPGKTANLDFRLTRRMRKLLDRYRRLSVNAVITSRDSDGTRGVSRGVVTLVAPPKPRRR